jgi:hypothetical protein
MSVQEKPVGAKGKYARRKFDSVSGLWYAATDFDEDGCLSGQALPSPVQDTTEQTIQSRRMHLDSANELMMKSGLLPTPAPATLWARFSRNALWSLIMVAMIPTTLVWRIIQAALAGTLA